MLPIALLLLAASATSLTPDEQVLLKWYEICMADSRGGVTGSNLDDIPCSYIKNVSESGIHEVECRIDPHIFVRITYQLLKTSNTSASRENLDYCNGIHHIVVGNDDEYFEVDFDPAVGIPSLVRSPNEYQNWHSWIFHRPLAVRHLTINNLNKNLPPLEKLKRLLTFSMSESPGILSEEKDFPLLPVLPPSTEVIHLQRNKFKYFPITKNFSLENLRYLDLSHNRLRKYFFPFDGNACNAPALEKLSLRNCELDSIKPLLGSTFPKLRWLDISQNKIHTFGMPHTRGVPKTLTFLNVSYNRESPQSLPNYIFSPLLQVLDVSYTRPRYSPNTILHWDVDLPKLSRLYASGYDNIQLSNIHSEYVKMTMKYSEFPIILNSTIGSLDISGGNLRHLHNLGLNETTVRKLDISTNQVKQWTDTSIFQNKLGIPWVTNVNLSHNKICIMSQEMLQSLEVLNLVDFGNNPFSCNNCSIYAFQVWLKKNLKIVSNLNRSHIPPRCGSPLRYIAVTESDHYRSFCVIQRWWTIVFALSAVCVFLVAQCYLMYYFRLKIVFMLHMYKLRVGRCKEEVDECTHDVFVCYSSADRLFVMRTLAPFIENGAPENYRAYIHERSFTLGSDINMNIVEAIEKSRRALLVVSQAFLKSQYCKKEFDMVTHRAFDGTPGYLLLLRYGPLKKEMVPRPLRLYMTTNTYLEWPDDPDELEILEVRKRLVNALGTSLHQRAQRADANEKARVTEDALEDAVPAAASKRRLFRFLRCDRGKLYQHSSEKPKFGALL